MYLKESDLTAFLPQLVHGLPHCSGNRTHGNDDVRCFRIPVIVEQFVIASRDLVDLMEILLDDSRKIIVILIVCFPYLEVDVAILYRVSKCWMFRIQRPVLEVGKRRLIDQFGDLIHVRDLDLVDLMRCSESVEKVHERNAGLDCCEVRYRCQIHDFLYRCRTVLGKARVSASHNVRMVAKNTHRMSTDRSGCNVQDYRMPFSGDSV